MSPQDEDFHESKLFVDNGGTADEESDLRKPPHLASFGLRMKYAREARNLTQVQVAETLAISQSAISRYELDQDIPSGIVLQRMLTLYEINAAWLIDYKGPMDVPEYAISEEAKRIVQALDALPKAERERLVGYILALIAASSGERRE